MSSTTAPAPNVSQNANVMAGHGFGHPPTAEPQPSTTTEQRFQTLPQQYLPQQPQQRTQSGELRAKLVGILADTANGCLSELGCHPREVKALKDRADHWQAENVKLYEDNRKLSEQYRTLAQDLEQLRTRPPNEHIIQLQQAVRNLHNTVGLLQQERDRIRADWEVSHSKMRAMEQQQPEGVAYKTLYAEYHQLARSHEALKGLVEAERLKWSKLLAHCSNCPAFLGSMGQPVVQQQQQQQQPFNSRQAHQRGLSGSALAAHPTNSNGQRRVSGSRSQPSSQPNSPLVQSQVPASAMLVGPPTRRIISGLKPHMQQGIPGSSGSQSNRPSPIMPSLHPLPGEMAQQPPHAAQYALAPHQSAPSRHPFVNAPGAVVGGAPMQVAASNVVRWQPPSQPVPGMGPPTAANPQPQQQPPALQNMAGMTPAQAIDVDASYSYNDQSSPQANVAQQQPIAARTSLQNAAPTSRPQNFSGHRSRNSSISSAPFNADGPGGANHSIPQNGSNGSAPPSQPSAPAHFQHAAPRPINTGASSFVPSSMQSPPPTTPGAGISNAMAGFSLEGTGPAPPVDNGMVRAGAGSSQPSGAQGQAQSFGSQGLKPSQPPTATRLAEQMVQVGAAAGQQAANDHYQNSHTTQNSSSSSSGTPAAFVAAVHRQYAPAPRASASTVPMQMSLPGWQPGHLQGSSPSLGTVPGSTDGGYSNSDARGRPPAPPPHTASAPSNIGLGITAATPKRSHSGTAAEGEGSGGGGGDGGKRRRLSEMDFDSMSPMYEATPVSTSESTPALAHRSVTSPPTSISDSPAPLMDGGELSQARRVGETMRAEQTVNGDEMQVDSTVAELAVGGQCTANHVHRSDSTGLAMEQQAETGEGAGGSEDEEDGDQVRIGPDGKRLASDCLDELFLAAADGVGRICDLCKTRYEAELVSTLEPFVDASEAELIAHIEQEHPGVWDTVRSVDSD